MSAELNRRSFVKSTGLLVGACLGQQSQVHAGPREPNVSERWDVLVCGGGPAGVAAAVNAARLGAKTLLLERYGRLGGMGVTGLVGPLMGRVQSPVVDEMLNKVGGRRPMQERLDIDYAAVVWSADFVVDIDNPAGPGQAEGFAAKVRPYDIPYGCLVPEKIDGLLLTGRCISGSHDAHASYRVQCIAAAIGAAAGVAAGLCAKQDVPPRRLNVSHVQQVLRPGFV